MSMSDVPELLCWLSIPMLFCVRKLVMPVLRSQMGKVSEAVPRDAEADAVCTAPARTKLQFQRFDESSPSREAGAARDAVVARSKRLFRIAFAMDLVAGLAHCYVFSYVLHKLVRRRWVSMASLC